ncbi:MAG: hypothetical protein GY795_18215 [Desulfobacterales bacterium]|nr:hypothetical protein [Desulfobacterales bacterium]
MNPQIHESLNLFSSVLFQNPLIMYIIFVGKLRGLFIDPGTITKLTKEYWIKNRGELDQELAELQTEGWSEDVQRQYFQKQMFSACAALCVRTYFLKTTLYSYQYCTEILQTAADSAGAEVLIGLVAKQQIEDKYKHFRDDGIVVRGTKIAKEVTNRDVEKTFSNRLLDIQETAFQISMQYIIILFCS